MKYQKLSPEFYLREDVKAIARDLIGKVLVTTYEGVRTSGIITETEAYEGETDQASHAFGGRNTPRTSIMYREGGIAYIYLCYGIHSLFNVVTNQEGRPHAVLIRALYPLEGQDAMQSRNARIDPPWKMAFGPGKLSKAMGIHFSETGISLMGERLWIEDRGYRIPESLVLSGKRIGVAYAAEHADWPNRYFIKANKLELSGLVISG